MRGIKRKSYILPIFALVVVILSVGYLPEDTAG